MGRKTTENFYKVPRALTDVNNRISYSAMALYLWLCELEQRFTEEYGKRDWFMYTNEELSKVSGMSINTVKKAKKELTEKGFINVDRGHWHYASTGKSSVKQPTVYRITK